MSESLLIAQFSSREIAATSQSAFLNESIIELIENCKYWNLLDNRTPTPVSDAHDDDDTVLLVPILRSLVDPGDTWSRKKLHYEDTWNYHHHAHNQMH